ncbi:LrgB family protein [Anaerobium acetethylicum]|uniref:TIGR00659 family protein n=1 Tax=Anaerobium acetethylicum TaxID=1619234 RepID=A0A1D3TYV5_9FIRM|nr:LrgB family protein [Anaerobium acetethylicum]SCP99669.1 TIGR00659 family protein [Anaerobium acetethylicum]
MLEILSGSAYFGFFISLFCFFTGVFIQKKTGLRIMNPLMLSIIMVIAILQLSGIDYKAYNQGAQIISYFLTPATICLAIPLYKQLRLLKDNALAILVSIVFGTVTSIGSIFLMSKLFGMDHTFYASLLPKSITTAIGMGISEELGGIVTITVAVIIITGILGNVISDLVFKLFRISNPIAKGLALGTSAHAIGTARAMELGEIEGAMSGLSIAVAGIVTVILAPMAANWIG